MQLMSFRNGVQDLVYTIMFTGLDPNSNAKEMRTKVRSATRKERTFRKQAFALYNNEVDQIMRSLRAFGAVAPCEKCNCTGKLQCLEGPPKRCKACKGTGWELLV